MAAGLAADEEALRRVLTAALTDLPRPSSPWGAASLLVLLSALFLVAAVIAAAGAVWHQRDAERQRLAAAALLGGAGGPQSKDDRESLAHLLRDALPAWVLSPDSSSCSWLNGVLGQVWPRVERFAGKFLMADGLLEGMVNATTFWRPTVLRSSYFNVQHVSLGQDPPYITGIKSFKQSGVQNEVLVESSFAWDSKMEVKLTVMLLGRGRQKVASAGGHVSASTWSWQSLLSRVSRVRIGVSNLAVRGTLRISIKPLLDDFPFAGAVKVSVVGTPEFSYHIKVLGGDPYLVPGVKLVVDSFIKSQVLTPFTFPDGFTYDLTSLSVAPFEVPEGLLEVVVVEATGVPRMDTFGKCDPYVRLWVRNSQKLQTATRSGTLSPRWDETFTFLVHNSEAQQLTLALYDSDLWSHDDLIGQVSLPLADLDLTPGVPNELCLRIPRGGEDEGHERWQGNRVGGPSVRARSTGGGSLPPGVAPVVLPTDAGSGGAAGGGGSDGDDTARTFSGGSDGSALRSPFEAAASGSMSQQQQQQQPGEQSLGARSATSVASGALQQLQNVRDLAQRQLEALRPRGCQLHVIATYYPLSEQEIAAVEREASRQQRGDAQAITRTQSLVPGSRVSNLLQGGLLFVYLDRAENMSTSSGGFTKNLKVAVIVGGQRKTTERGKVPFRSKAAPVFDETLELVVPGSTARSEEAEVVVEVWVDRLVRRPVFKGRAVVPLSRVVADKKIRETFPMRDTPHGRASTLTMELSAAALAACLLTFAAGSGYAEAHECVAKDDLGCLLLPGYHLPNYTYALRRNVLPAMPVVGLQPPADLRALLPLNEAIASLNATLRHDSHWCPVPVLSSDDLSACAKDPASPGCEGLDACSLAPFPTAPAQQQHYVVGGFNNLAALGPADPKLSPALAALQKLYAAQLGPNMGLCVATNPCQLTAFVGLTGVEKDVGVSRHGVSLALRPSALFYSYHNAALPPSWRLPNLPPAFWQNQPAVAGATGVSLYMSALSTPYGTTYLAGKLAPGALSSTVSLPCATLDLSPQTEAWVLYRDERRVAVSLGLSQAPDMHLWDQRTLRLGYVPGLADVQVLTRRPTCQVWLQARNQSVLASDLYKALPEVGAAVAHIYQGSRINPSAVIEGLDVYAAGSKGVGLRLTFQGGQSLQLTTAAASVVGTDFVSTDGLQLVLSAASPGVSFAHAGVAAAARRGGFGVTLQWRGSTHLIRFCIKNSDCAAALHCGCNTTTGVCKPRDAQAGLSIMSADADAHAHAAAPMPAHTPGTQLLGDACTATKDCHRSLRCRRVPTAGQRLCLERAGRRRRTLRRELI